MRPKIGGTHVRFRDGLSQAPALLPSMTRPTPTRPEGALATGSFPPSARTILGTLQGRKPMTSADIRMASGLAPRTLYGALRVLRERGLLLAQPSLRDARQCYYWLVDGAVRPGEPHETPPAPKRETA